MNPKTKGIVMLVYGIVCDAPNLNTMGIIPI